MPNKRIVILAFSVFALATSCTQNRKDDKVKVKPMVYEGMPAIDLRNTLGEPDSTDSSGSVYDANKGKTIKVQKWYYEKRTVVLIDDTVITPNLPDIN